MTNARLLPAISRSTEGKLVTRSRAVPKILTLVTTQPHIHDLFLFFLVQFPTITFPEPPAPPPRNVEVSDKTSDRLSVQFTLIDPPFSDKRGAALLYRKNNSQEAYSFLLRVGRTVTEGPVTMNMQKLSPKTGYEIKLATLSRVIELPGIFRTITDRTFGKTIYFIYMTMMLPNMVTRTGKI